MLRIRHNLKYVWGGIAFLGMLLTLGCGPRETESSSSGKWVIALKPDKNPDAMLEEKNALEQFLGGRLGREVEVIIPTSGAVIEQGLANGTIDLAFLSSTSAARYRVSGGGDILLAVEIDGSTSYRSIWVSLKEKTYETVESLRGKAVCFASPTSTSGYIIPIWDLNQRGLLSAGGSLEAFFGAGNVMFGTGYVSAVERVLNGQVEAAAVSDYVMEEDKHLSAEQKALLRIVQSQGPVPTHVLYLREGLSSEDIALLKFAFQELNGDPTGLGESIFGGSLVEVDASQHLQPIESALSFAQSL